MKNIVDEVMAFYNEIKGDENHRYKSWEHCYEYFCRADKDIDNDTAALHLAFYLASWGMYRGSTDLIWKDYKIHTKVVEYILGIRSKFKDLDFSKFDDKILKEIIEVKDEIAKIYNEEINTVNGEKKEGGQSNILISKVMLGTLGCVPAYDTLFTLGLRTSKISPAGFSYEGLKALGNFYLKKKNKDGFDSLRKKIKIGKRPYPVMKLIDMYFWQVGKREAEKLAKEKKRNGREK